MRGDLEVYGAGHSTESDTAEQWSSECEDAATRQWGGVGLPFPYDSCAAAAYSNDDVADAEETEGPRWFRNVLAALALNPLKGLGPAITDGILNAAADTGGKGGKGGKVTKKPAPPAAPRKGGEPVLSKEEWLERIQYFLAMGRNHVAFRARFKNDGDKVKRDTLLKYTKRYLEAKAKAQAHASTRPSASNSREDWSVIAESLKRNSGGKP